MATHIIIKKERKSAFLPRLKSWVSTRGSFDEEFEESENGLDTENCWCDFYPNAFVDIVTAKSHDEACQKA